MGITSAATIGHWNTDVKSQQISLLCWLDMLQISKRIVVQMFNLFWIVIFQWELIPWSGRVHQGHLKG
jgi:hypothetical protein